MAGNGKHFVWQDYLTVYEIVWKGGIFSLDAPVAGSSKRSQDSKNEGMIFLDSMESDQPSQEDILLKKEAFLNLSSEAKEVILLILNSPQEILDCFLTPKYNKISKDKVWEFLVNVKGWKPRIIAKCFRELKEFSMNFH